MDAIAVFGGGATATLCVSSSVARDTRLSCAPRHNLNLRISHLAAFRPPSHFFSPSSPCPYASKKLNKPRIFLPHLVASMVLLVNFIRHFRDFDSKIYLIGFLVCCFCSGRSGGELYYD